MATQEMAVKEKKKIKKGARESLRPGPVFIPAVDILENENDILVLADMPGVASSNVDVDLRENVLTIQGRVDPIEGENETSVHQEFEWGDYFRQFTLSDAIDQERIQAKMDQGVLRLVLPKVEKMKPRKIEVRAG